MTIKAYDGKGKLDDVRWNVKMQLLWSQIFSFDNQDRERGHIVEKAQSQYCVHPFFAAIMAAVPAYRVIRDYFAE